MYLFQLANTFDSIEVSVVLWYIYNYVDHAVKYLNAL